MYGYIFVLVVLVSFQSWAQNLEVYKIKGLDKVSIEVFRKDIGPKKASYSQPTLESNLVIDKVYLSVPGHSSMRFEEKVVQVIQAEDEVIVFLDNPSLENLSYIIYSKNEKGKLQISKQVQTSLSKNSFIIESRFKRFRIETAGKFNFYQAIETNPGDLSKKLVTVFTSDQGYLKTWEEPFKAIDQSGEHIIQLEQMLKATKMESYLGLRLTKDHYASIAEVQQRHEQIALLKAAKNMEPLSMGEIAKNNEKILQDMSVSMRNITGLDTLKNALLEQVQYLLTYGEVKPMVLIEGQGSLVDKLLGTLRNSESQLLHFAIDFKSIPTSTPEGMKLFQRVLHNTLLELDGMGNYLSFKNWEYASSEARNLIKHYMQMQKIRIKTVLPNGKGSSVIVDLSKIQILKRTSLYSPDLQEIFAQSYKTIENSFVMGTVKSHKKVYKRLAKHIIRDDILRKLSAGKVEGNSFQAMRLKFNDSELTEAARIEMAYPQTMYEYLLDIQKQYDRVMSFHKESYPGKRLYKTSMNSFLEVAKELYHPRLDSSFSSRVIEEVKTQLAKKSNVSLANERVGVNLKLDLKRLKQVLKSEMCNLGYM